MNYILRADVFPSSTGAQKRLLDKMKNEMPDVSYATGRANAVFFSAHVNGNSARYEARIRALTRGAKCYVYYEPCPN